MRSLTTGADKEDTMYLGQRETQTPAALVIFLASFSQMFRWLLRFDTSYNDNDHCITATLSHRPIHNFFSHVLFRKGAIFLSY